MEIKRPAKKEAPQQEDPQLAADMAEKARLGAADQSSVGAEGPPFRVVLGPDVVRPAGAPGATGSTVDARAPAVTLRVVSDSPLEADQPDLLDMDPYAQALAAVIDNPETRPPLTIAINAPWGAGKTSLARRVAHLLQNKPAAGGHFPHVVCWYNAWLHDDAPSLAASLTSEIARKAGSMRPTWRRVLRPLPIWLASRSEQTGRRLLVPSAWVVVVAAAAVLLSGPAGRNERVTELARTLTQLVGGKASPTDAPARAESGPASVPDTATEARRPFSAPKAAQPTPGAAPEPHVTGSGSLGMPESDAGRRPRTRVPPARQAQQEPRARGIVPPSGEAAPAITLSFGAVLLAIVKLLDTFTKPAISAWQGLASFLGNPSTAAATGAAAVAPDELRALVRQATPRGSRFVVFVDDLDRCRPPRAVELLEGINQMLSHQEIVVVLVADMPLVAASAGLRYAPLARLQRPTGGIAAPNGTGGAADANTAQLAFGRLFVQKMVQLQFDMPPCPEERIQRFVARVSGIDAGPTDDGAPAVTHSPEPEVAGRPAPSAQLPLAPGLSEYIGGTAIDTVTQVVTGLLVPLLGIGWSMATSGGTVTRASGWLLLALVAASGAWALVRPRARILKIDRLRTEVAESLAKGTAASLRANAFLFEQLRLRVMNESTILKEAFEEVVRWIPPLPRHAKRLINQTRLTVAIASERGMLDGAGAVSARQIGKWVALRERWPELAQALLAAPTRLAEFEETASEEQLVQMVAPIDPSAAADPELREFCREDCRIGAVLPQLIEFRAPSPGALAAGS